MGKTCRAWSVKAPLPHDECPYRCESGGAYRCKILIPVRGSGNMRACNMYTCPIIDGQGVEVEEVIK